MADIIWCKTSACEFSFEMKNCMHHLTASSKKKLNSNLNKIKHFDFYEHVIKRFQNNEKTYMYMICA